MRHGEVRSPSLYSVWTCPACPQAILDLDGDRLVSRGEVVEVFQQLGSMGSRITGLQVSEGRTTAVLHAAGV